jgi:hypothetical protein
MKHDINLNAKGPYLARQLSDCLALTIPSNMIAKIDPDGCTQDTEIYTGSGPREVSKSHMSSCYFFLYSYARLQGLLVLATR